MSEFVDDPHGLYAWRCACGRDNPGTLHICPCSNPSRSARTMTAEEARQAVSWAKARIESRRHSVPDGVIAAARRLASEDGTGSAEDLEVVLDYVLERAEPTPP